jgi:TonB family protein
VSPPVEQLDIEAWIDRVRMQLDLGRPVKKKLGLEWVPVAGLAAGVLLLLVGSIYWFSGSNAKKDDPLLVAASATGMNAADSAAAPIRALAPSEQEAYASEVPTRKLRVPRVTEEEPTLPIETDTSPALRTGVKAMARSTATVATDGKLGRIDSRTSRTIGKRSASARTAKAKSKPPKLARRATGVAGNRVKPAKPAETKLALAEPVAPIQSGAMASTPSAPAPIIMMPRIKSMRTPYYPITEMRAGHTGTTTIELLVLESGLVGEATVLSSSGHPKLDAAAIDVAKRSWKFFPGTEDGKPRAMKIQAPVRFASVISP